MIPQWKEGDVWFSARTKLCQSPEERVEVPDALSHLIWLIVALNFKAVSALEPNCAADVGQKSVGLLFQWIQWSRVKRL